MAIFPVAYDVLTAADCNAPKQSLDGWETRRARPVQGPQTRHRQHVVRGLFVTRQCLVRLAIGICVLEVLLSSCKQELLELGDRIGYVSTGLKDDEIARCLGTAKLATSTDLSLQFASEMERKCSICQVSFSPLLQ